MVSCRGLQFGDLPAGVGRKLLKENLAVLIGSPFQMNVPINLVNGDHCAGKGPAVGSIHLQYPQARKRFIGECHACGGVVSVDHHVLHGVLVQQMVLGRRDFGDDVAARPRNLEGRKPIRIRGDVAHNAFFRMADLEHRAGQGLFRSGFHLVDFNPVFFLFRRVRGFRFSLVLSGHLHICRDRIGVQRSGPHLLGAIFTAPKEQGICLPVSALVCGNHHRGGQFAACGDGQIVVHLVEGHTAGGVEMEIA